LIDVVFPLVLTIFHFIAKLFLEEEVEENELYKLLKEPKGFSMMMEFLKAEYSVENLYCWSEIMKFKNVEKEDQMMKSVLDNEGKKRALYCIYAKRIADKFFNGEKSLMEVNVQKKDTDVIWKKLKVRQVDETIFDKIFGTIRENLADSFSRLVSTADYQAFKLEKELEKEFMDKDKLKKYGLMKKIKKYLTSFKRNVMKRLNALRTASSSISSLEDTSMDLGPIESKNVEIKEITLEPPVSSDITITTTTTTTSNNVSGGVEIMVNHNNDSSTNNNNDNTTNNNNFDNTNINNDNTTQAIATEQIATSEINSKIDEA